MILKIGYKNLRGAEEGVLGGDTKGKDEEFRVPTSIWGWELGK